MTITPMPSGIPRVTLVPACSGVPEPAGCKGDKQNKAHVDH